MSGHPWSGLAPAVDAYLFRRKRLERVDRLLRNADKSNDRMGAAVQVMQTNPEFARWVRFAKSYGHVRVGDDGKVHVVHADGQYGDDGSLAHIVETAGGTIAGPEQRRPATLDDVRRGAGMALEEFDMLANAIPHYVSGDVMNEVFDACDFLAEPEPLFETDLITTHGLAVFERPLVVGDVSPIDGEYDDRLEQPIRAIGWKIDDDIHASDTAEAMSGVSLMLYTTPADHDRIYLPSVIEAGYGDRIEPVDPDLDPNELVVIEVNAWPFRRSWQVVDTVAEQAAANPAGETVHIPPVAQFRAFFLTFMRLCWQDVIVRTRVEDESTRPERRRWQRERPKMDVAVLRLRRKVYPDQHETGTGRELGYRVMVRGHWRRQHYPSLGDARLNDGAMNPESHRLVWIEPHWRGPEGAPEHVPIPATAVVR